MTQDERWQSRYDEVKAFIEANHRNPSKYVPEEKLMTHFLKRGRKLLNVGELSKHPTPFQELSKIVNTFLLVTSLSKSGKAERCH